MKLFNFSISLTATLGALHLKRAQEHTPTLQSILNDDGINAYFPGQSEYANVSAPFNLRLSFQPAAVAFPTTVVDVAQAIRAGASLGLPGVSAFFCIS